jgi:DNA mismatch endonuclease (patch repair protein)
MAAVKSTNTKPEVAVRRLLHALGYRFRLHSNDLPGRPDMVLPKYKTVVLVHGCFWHQHPDCKPAARPASNLEYWSSKLDRTVIRDRKQQAELEALGWQVVVVWECEIRDAELVTTRLQQALKTPR